MRTLTTILATFILTHSLFSQTSLSYSDKTFVYELKIDSSLLPDSSTFSCAVKTITVIRKADQKIIQVIRVPENSNYCDTEKNELFIIEDVNFDKYNDIRLLEHLPASPNLPYYFWTYNKSSKRFERKKSLESITSPEFDHKKEIITSFWRASCCDHGLSTYRYYKGIPVLIEETETAQDSENENKLITTVKRRIKGKMKLVERTVDLVDNSHNN